MPHAKSQEVLSPLSAAGSSIEDLARIVSLSRNWKDVRFAMMTACFDAAGHERDQKFVVVAGFVSSAQHWAEFDAAWRDRLAEDGLAHFRMVDFRHSRGEFAEGWKDNESRRQNLLNDLMEFIRKFAYRKFGCIVQNEWLSENISAKTRKRYHLKSYVLAARDCAAKVRQWTATFHGREVPRLVFEYGDLYQGLLTKRLVDDLFAPPCFEFKKDRLNEDGTEIKGFTPLQAADFLAYEMFLSAKERNITRWGMQQFESKPGPISIFLPRDLKHLGSMIESAYPSKEAREFSS